MDEPRAVPPASGLLDRLGLDPDGRYTAERTIMEYAATTEQPASGAGQLQWWRNMAHAVIDALGERGLIAEKCDHPSLDGTLLGEDVWLCMACGRLVERRVSQGYPKPTSAAASTTARARKRCRRCSRSLATVDYRVLDPGEVKELLG